MGSWSEPQSSLGLVFANCFAFPCSAAKHIISLIQVLIICDVHMQSPLLCCYKRVFAMTSAFSWQNSCQSLPCFILYSKAKVACYSRYLLTYYFCIPVPYDEKDFFFFMLVLECLVSLHRTVQLQLLWHQWLWHRLGLL